MTQFMKLRDFKVGFFLFTRYIKKANISTTILISLVMFLTFINLTVVGGILEGIIVGSFEGLRTKAIGDILISSKNGDPRIERSQYIIRELNNDDRVAAFSPRHIISSELITEQDFYKITNNREKRKTISSTAFGVDPELENNTTGLSRSIIEGNYFSSANVRDEVLIGSDLLQRYSPFGDFVLEGVYPGEYVYVILGSAEETSFGGRRGGSSISTTPEVTSANIKKYKVAGIFRTKSGGLDTLIILNADEVRLNSTDNPSNNVTNIPIRLHNQEDAAAVRDSLEELGYGRYATIETLEEGVGSFLDDIRVVFRLLGSIVGIIGLVASSITIFIIIFVTAISRSKYIGILKAIGVTPAAIKISYVLYALFFAAVGITIGMALLYLILVPYVDANPIPFPFSEGVLYVPLANTLIQVGLLLLTTLIAGYVPSAKVIRKPAIDAVRGR